MSLADNPEYQSHQFEEFGLSGGFEIPDNLDGLWGLDDMVAAEKASVAEKFKRLEEQVARVKGFGTDDIFCESYHYFPGSEVQWKLFFQRGAANHSGELFPFVHVSWNQILTVGANDRQLTCKEFLSSTRYDVVKKREHIHYLRYPADPDAVVKTKVPILQRKGDSLRIFNDTSPMDPPTRDLKAPLSRLMEYASNAAELTEILAAVNTGTHEETVRLVRKQKAA